MREWVGAIASGSLALRAWRSQPTGLPRSDNAGEEVTETVMARSRIAIGERWLGPYGPPQGRKRAGLREEKGCLMVTATDAYVLRFNDAGGDEHDLVGGKGANLGRLTAAGFPVPPGFTVTTAAYQAFVASGAGEKIDALVAELTYDDAEALERLTSEIRRTVTERPLPDAVAHAIRSAYGELVEGTYVAVRSSGTAEDLADASFAGLHDTYLDIVGSDGVLDAVRRCWASLWTARAVSYRNTKGFGQGNGIAVVVQTMVPSEVAGVMFTANPVTSATDEIVINASWGLGEAIVSGITTPDEFTVSHRDLRIKQRTLGSKEKRVVRDPASAQGTVEVDTPAAERERFSLTDEQIADLARLGRRVQDHYGDFPQDTEWGYANEQFYLLQSRPVTGVDLSWDAELENWQWNDEAPDDQVWSRAWADAVWSGGCTPLFYSLRGPCQKIAIEYGLDIWGVREAKGLRAHKYWKGTPYYNCSLEKEVLEKTAFSATRAGMLDHVPPAWHQEILDAPFNFLQYLRLQARCQFIDPMNGVATWRKTVDKFLVDGIKEASGLTVEELRDLSDAELRRYCEHMQRLDIIYVEEVWSIFFIHARESMGLLATLLAKWYDGPRETVYTDLLTGVPRPTASQIESTKLWELAKTIKESDALRRAFEEHEGRAFFHACGESEEGREWLARYEAFVEYAGHRGHSNRDIYHLRRHEDPAVDYRALQTYLSVASDEHPEVKEHVLEAKRQEVIAEVLENVRRKSFGALRAEVLKATLEYVMMFLLWRDDERYYVDRLTYSAKRGFNEIMRRLVERGQLAEQRDGFFLTDQDLYSMLYTGAKPALTDEKIAARKRNFFTVEMGESTNPVYLVRNMNADLDYDRVPGEELPEGMFKGAGTSGGTIEGTARVIRDLKDIGIVRHGEILIVNATDPGWTPVFLVIAGVVIETGGMLAHASCLAREYGMPAVHLPRAMKLIPDGAGIRVNGSTGTVEILQASEAMTESGELVGA
jgi:rifampicin phosphotransferase